MIYYKYEKQQIKLFVYTPFFIMFFVFTLKIIWKQKKEGCLDC
jgi:hypothetical protein